MDSPQVKWITTYTYSNIGTYVSSKLDKLPHNYVTTVWPGYVF